MGLYQNWRVWKTFSGTLTSGCLYVRVSFVRKGSRIRASFKMKTLLMRLSCLANRSARNRGVDTDAFRISLTLSQSLYQTPLLLSLPFLLLFLQYKFLVGMVFPETELTHTTTQKDPYFHVHSTVHPVSKLSLRDCRLTRITVRPTLYDVSQFSLRMLIK